MARRAPKLKDPSWDIGFRLGRSEIDGSSIRILWGKRREYWSNWSILSCQEIIFCMAEIEASWLWLVFLLEISLIESCGGVFCDFGELLIAGVDKTELGRSDFGSRGLIWRESYQVKASDLILKACKSIMEDLLFGGKERGIYIFSISIMVKRSSRSWVLVSWISLIFGRESIGLKSEFYEGEKWVLGSDVGKPRF